MKSMMIFRRMLFKFGILFLVLAAAEAGLRFREFLIEHYEVPVHVIKSNECRILFLGDSILGIGDTNDGSIQNIARRALEGLPTQYRTKNISKPGNYSSSANESIDPILKSYKPAMLVLMLGRSDWSINNRPQDISWVTAQWHNLVSHLKLLQFYVRLEDQITFGLRSAFLAMSESARLTKASLENERFVIAPLLGGCELSPKGTDSMVNIESGIRNYPNNRRIIGILYRCYFKKNEIQRGLKFFQEIKPISKESALISQMIEIMEIEAKTKEATFNELSGETTRPKDWDSYIMALWVYRKFNKVNEANRLFAKGDRFYPSRDENLDEYLYQQIIKKAIASGAQVLTLQYPNENDWKVKKAIAPFPQNWVHFLSLRNLLVQQLSGFNIFELLSDDFVHAAPMGAKILGNSIANEIENINPCGVNNEAKLSN